MATEKAETTPITLYPRQIAIVEAFAAKDGRKFSNAVQFIIEAWYATADPEGVLLKQAKPTAPRKPTLADIPVRKGAVQA